MGTKPLYLNQRSHAASDPIRNFRFLVRFTSPETVFPVKFDQTLGFMAVSGLAIATEAIPYREGGFNSTVHYLPGKQTFSPVTFQRGLTLGSSQHWQWFTQLFDVGYGIRDSSADRSDLTGNFRCNVDISVLAHPQPLVANRDKDIDDPVVHRFSLMNAWITNLSYSDLNAADDAVLVEQITLVHEGMSQRWAPKPDPTRPDWNLPRGDAQF